MFKKKTNILLQPPKPVLFEIITWSMAGNKPLPETSIAMTNDSNVVSLWLSLDVLEPPENAITILPKQVSMRDILI